MTGTQKHVNEMHLKLPMYRCKTCDIPFFQKSHACKHIDSTHDGHESHIEDNYVRHMATVRQQYRHFFPKGARNRDRKLVRDLRREKRLARADELEGIEGIDRPRRRTRGRRAQTEETQGEQVEGQETLE